MKYENKIAVVTGAGGTLCSEIAIHLAKEGARVVLVGRNKEKLLNTADKMTPHSAMVYPCDVTDENKVEELLEATLKTFSKCDFLINGAGGNNVLAMTGENTFDEKDEKNFLCMGMEKFEEVLKINTMGTVIPSKVFLKHMIENKEGAIINFASMNTYRPLSKVPAYAMSKAAISNFTQWLAAYAAPYNIRVNAIAPGFFVNERSKLYLGTVEEGLTQRGEKVISHTPMGRFGVASDLLGCVDFMLDKNMSAFLTGVTIPIDGGFLSCPGI